tara:strand:+ start:705 stop:1049 length:345 start_codon:yes stop_codon:yes gene_type:complete
MKIENLIGIGLIGILVWQISKRGNGGAPTFVTNQAPERNTRWEDVALQGIRTVGEVGAVAIQRSRAGAAANSAQCRANAQQQVAAARASGVTVQGNDWASVEEQIYQACVAGIS